MTSASPLASPAASPPAPVPMSGTAGVAAPRVAPPLGMPGGGTTRRSPSISALLMQCTPSTHKATLRALALAARSEESEAWEKHFGRALILVLDSLSQKEIQGIRETALLCLQELIAGQPDFFKDFAEVVASRLFETYRACDTPAEKHTAAMVDRTLERLLGVIEPSRALEILVPVINAESAPLLQMATRMVSTLLQREVVLPGVVAAFSNPNADVRKAAVFCLVDVYMSLGEQAMPFLVKDLTPSQMKLVTIYIGRQQREREELGQAASFAHGQDGTQSCD